MNFAASASASCRTAPCGRTRTAPNFISPPCQPDIFIDVRPVPALPEPAGELLGAFGEKKLWRSGDLITRQTKDPFRPLPHMSASYTLADVRHVTCHVREEDWR